jgi:O-antigen biosynthesis protein
MNNIAVVTAVAGGYDHVGSHKFYHDDVDYLFFTDGKTLPLDEEWQVCEFPEGVTDDPWRLAKIPKINPHMIPKLREYNYVIWIDGSMQIVARDFVSDMLGYLDKGLVLSPHFDGRDCGYGEATIRPPKYAGEPLDEQCDAYRTEGFPEHFGLWECGVECRDMNKPGVAEFGAMWFEQIMKWSIQDQVSCGYSMWKTGFVPDVLPRSWREYGWIHLNAHKYENPREDPNGQQ